MTPTLNALRAKYPNAETFTFGDSAELCAELIELVRSGVKTATTGACRDFVAGEPMPKVGRRDICLDWSGAPALVIETIEVRHCAFDEVTEEMALAEGENASLLGWRNDHREFFERNGGFSPDMPVVWERFALVEDLG
ncbi:ASCH domain-containing protein [Marivita sp. GX14005]|uniref:ASCH domain-containing protein n=1 Tax=Marivita sp. GX14005 TaxID=2942276 RepID=UPI0020186CE4|nr:ASCH domain-containing protein [Marivita sp. GX14005]MCL3882453.1 ASCH domain-containing protein [Marivita sp. GX14005]